MNIKKLRETHKELKKSLKDSPPMKMRLLSMEEYLKIKEDDFSYIISDEIYNVRYRIHFDNKNKITAFEEIK